MKKIPETSRHLDELDRKILRVLQQDSSLSIAEIADRIGLSATPCWQRIQKLERDGIILGRVALVDQDKIGLKLTSYVFLETTDHSYAWLKSFAKTIKAMPDVVEFHRMAGDVDYMLRVVTRDAVSHEALLRQLQAFAGISKVTARIVSERLKLNTVLPIATLKPPVTPATPLLEPRRAKAGEGAPKRQSQVA